MRKILCNYILILCLFTPGHASQLYEIYKDEFLVHYQYEEYKFAVDAQCRQLDSDGISLPMIVVESLTTGLQCLDHLGYAASKNADKIRAMFSSSGDSQRPKFYCSDSWVHLGQGWDTLAHASVDDVNNKELRDGHWLLHPYISLAPSTSLEAPSISGLIFHELLHNLGYLHTEHIEYSYSCEQCCFFDKSPCSCSRSRAKMRWPRHVQQAPSARMWHGNRLV